MNMNTLIKMTPPLRDDLEISYHDIGPEGRKPQLALVAGLQGNELNGVFVLSRLASFLNQIQAGQRPGQLLRERVLVIPAANLPGVNTGSRARRFPRTDLKRHFPATAQGDCRERVAAAVLELTRQAYYRADIHSSDLDLEQMPQIRLYAPNDDERASACLFGLPAVIERPLNRIATSNLVHAWRVFGGENFVIQAGQAGNLQLQHCETLFRSLVAFLDRTGIVEGVTLAADEDDLHYFGAQQSFTLISDRAGIFVSRLEVGRWIQAGEMIGHIYDGFMGNIHHEVVAPVGGLVSGLRRQPLLFEGDLIARIQTRERTGKDS